MKHLLSLLRLSIAAYLPKNCFPRTTTWHLIFNMGQLLQMARVTIFGSKKKARNAVPFDVIREISSLAGKVVLVTGGAEGMGREVVMELVRHGRPARIYVADLPLPGNDAEEALVKSIKDEAYYATKDSATGDAWCGAAPQTDIRFLELDLGNKEKTRQCAASFLAPERLDILILNAGFSK